MYMTYYVLGEKKNDSELSTTFYSMCSAFYFIF